MNRQLLQQALKALEWLLANIRRNAPELSGKAMGNAEVAITALREALNAPEPEPVARCILDNGDEMGSVEWLVRPRSIRLDNGSLLYAAPPAAPAPVVPLTDEQAKRLVGASDDYWATSKLFIMSIVRVTEAAHNITGASK